jgi:hypothetical protein
MVLKGRKDSPHATPVFSPPRRSAFKYGSGQVKDDVGFEANT